MANYGTKGLRLELLARWGGVSFLAGVAIETCFAALIPLATLRGPAVANFLAFYVIAGAAYAVAVARLGRSAAWVSRLTRNPLGRLVANHAREVPGTRISLRI